MVVGSDGNEVNDAYFGVGKSDAAGETDFTSFTLHSSDAGTGTDLKASSLILQPGLGTGTGAGSKVAVNRAIQLTTGTTAQSAQNASVWCESKVLSNTTGQAQSLATIALPSNSSGAARVTVSVQCTNATEYASSITTSYQAFANKAGTIAVGTPQNGTEANGASTGATINCTVVPTWVTGTNVVDLKVTPVITGTASLTTGWVNLEVFGSGTAVTCN